MMRKYGLPIIVYLLCISLNAFSAAVSTGERHRLYTETDSANPGGIKGRISKPSRPILQILAMPPDEPRFVYKGEITGADQQGFLFQGLPMAKYDLFVIYDDEFYEGCTLNKEQPSTLTAEDLKKIRFIITASDPYFLSKTFHRIEGITGRSNFSRVICTMLRGEPTSDGRTTISDLRRTFKLIWLKDVGPGWQVVQKRDLYPCWTKCGAPKHNYKTVLSLIRVAGGVKDVGDIDLTKDNAKVVPVNKASSLLGNKAVKGAEKKPIEVETVKDPKDYLLE